MFLEQYALGIYISTRGEIRKREENVPKRPTVDGFIGIADGRWGRLQAEGVTHDLENSRDD